MPDNGATQTGGSGNRNDVWSTRLTIAGLFNTVFLSLLGIVVCQLQNREIPPSLVSIASTALGIVAGILIRADGKGPQT